MNHIVPDDFEVDQEEYLTQDQLPKKTTMGGDEDFMELLWHNGQLVMHNQNQRSSSNIPTKKTETIEEAAGPSHVFMQEDEMASWLHHPSDENSLENYLYNNDLLYPTPPVNPTTLIPPPPPPPPPPSVMISSSSPPVPVYRRTEAESGQPKYTNFSHFGRPNKIHTTTSGPGSLGLSASASKITTTLAVSTGVLSNKTPVLESIASRVSDKQTYVSIGNKEGGGSVSGIGVAGASSTGNKMETCEMSETSSHGTGGSEESAGIEPSAQKPPPPIDDRKRKGRGNEDNECHSEDVEFDAKSKSHGGSTSTKRSRAAEVHNLSERRRRDRINEKMKALQELIPRCNKSDKASMLDEAIEYLKSLQMQVQMMSMGCGMVPMMYPGVQQYVPPMAMGMGMGMGIDMGMNRPIVPYPAILPASSMPNPAAAHLGQRFPVPGYNISPVPVAGPAASQAANISTPIMTSFPLHSQNQPRAPNFTDPFQHYHAVQQTQGHELGGMPPLAIKPSSSSRKDTTNPDHHQTG